MGDSSLGSASVGLGAFGASSGYFGARESAKQSRYNHNQNVASAGINYLEQDFELNRMLYQLSQDEGEDTSIFIREANSRLATAANSLGVLDFASRSHIYNSEVSENNIELNRLGNNFDREAEAIRSGKRENVANYRNAVVGSTNVHASNRLRARQQAIQSIINGGSQAVSGYGDYQATKTRNDADG